MARGTRDESAYERKFAKVMREFDVGTLKSSSGEPVTSRRQAQAIAHSEAESATGDSADRHTRPENSR